MIEVGQNLLNDFKDYEELKSEDYEITDIYIVRPLFVHGKVAENIYTINED